MTNLAALRLLVLDVDGVLTDGTVLLVFGDTGPYPTRLFYPIGITCAPSGLLYVADQGQNRIAVFDPPLKSQSLLGCLTLHMNRRAAKHNPRSFLIHL